MWVLIYQDENYDGGEAGVLACSRSKAVLEQKKESLIQKMNEYNTESQRLHCEWRDQFRLAKDIIKNFLEKNKKYLVEWDGPGRVLSKNWSSCEKYTKHKKDKIIQYIYESYYTDFFTNESFRKELFNNEEVAKQAPSFYFRPEEMCSIEKPYAGDLRIVETEEL